jgi:GT2 family glycosyltransferase
LTAVVVLFRNAPRLASTCLESLRASAVDDAQYLLVDDCSDPGREVLPLLKEFRGDVSADVRVVRFKRPMHYGLGLAYALSIAPREADVLFVSHDMMLTPDCAAALRDAAAKDEPTGIVRPTSQHMDWAKSLAVSPPAPVNTVADAIGFSREVRQRFGAESVDWPMLIGDAMLIRRAVIDRIGVFDPQFDSFMGDIDYGLRARRAGFRHVIARGAWLHHEGAGTAKETAAAGGESVQEQGRRMVELVEAAYAKFRRKWGEAKLPPYFRDMKRQHFEALHALPPMPADAVVPPLAFGDDVGEIL